MQTKWLLFSLFCVRIIFTHTRTHAYTDWLIGQIKLIDFYTLNQKRMAWFDIWPFNTFDAKQKYKNKKFSLWERPGTVKEWKRTEKGDHFEAEGPLFFPSSFRVSFFFVSPIFQDGERERERRVCQKMDKFSKVFVEDEERCVCAWARA